MNDINSIHHTRTLWGLVCILHYTLLSMDTTIRPYLVPLNLTIELHRALNDALITKKYTLSEYSPNSILSDFSSLKLAYVHKGNHLYKIDIFTETHNPQTAATVLITQQTEKIASLNQQVVQLTSAKDAPPVLPEPKPPRSISNANYLIIGTLYALNNLIPMRYTMASRILMALASGGIAHTAYRAWQQRSTIMQREAILSCIGYSMAPFCRYYRPATNQLNILTMLGYGLSALWQTNRPAIPRNNQQNTIKSDNQTASLKDQIDCLRKQQSSWETDIEQSGYTPLPLTSFMHNNKRYHAFIKKLPDSAYTPTDTIYGTIYTEQAQQ